MVTKINVSVPEEVLQRIDEAAKKHGASRSAFLVRAAKHFLQEEEKERQRQERLKADESIIELADEIGPWDGTAEVLRWRDRH